MYNGIGAQDIYILVQIISGFLIAVGVCLQMWEEHPDVYGVRRSNRSRQEPARLNIGAGVSRRTKKPWKASDTDMWHSVTLQLSLLTWALLNKPIVPSSGRYAEVLLRFLWKTKLLLKCVLAVLIVSAGQQWLWEWKPEEENLTIQEKRVSMMIVKQIFCMIINFLFIWALLLARHLWFKTRPIL